MLLPFFLHSCSTSVSARAKEEKNESTARERETDGLSPFIKCCPDAAVATTATATATATARRPEEPGFHGLAAYYIAQSEESRGERRKDSLMWRRRT